MLIAFGFIIKGEFCFRGANFIFAAALGQFMSRLLLKEIKNPYAMGNPYSDHYLLRLLHRIAEACTANEPFTFSPGGAVLACFRRHPADNRLRVQFVPLAQTHWGELDDEAPLLEGSEWSERLRSSDFPLSWSPSVSLPGGNSSNGAYHLIPLALISAPLGILMIPHQEAGETPDKYVQQFGILSQLALSCTLEHILAIFDAPALRAILSKEELAERFARTVAPWVSPLSLFLQNAGGHPKLLEQGHGEFGEAAHQFSLVLQGGAGRFTLEFTLPSFYFLQNGESSPIHLYPESRLRLRLFINSLESIYRYLHGMWQQLRSTRVLEASLHQLSENFQSNQAVMEDIQKQLGNMIRQEATAPSQEPKFCFYRQSRQWTVCFDGRSVLTEFRSPQGMEAIRLMLDNEGSPLSVAELHQLLSVGKFIYPKAKGNKKAEHPDTDDANKRELLENLQSCREQEKSEGFERMSAQEKHKYWQYRLVIINVLIQYTSIKEYRSEWGYCKRKIQEIIDYVDDEDENFSDELYAVLKPSSKSGNEKNRKDSFVKGIKAALESLSGHAELYAHLQQTLVLFPREGYTYFTYAPDLAQDPKCRNIDWKTAP